MTLQKIFGIAVMAGGAAYAVIFLRDTLKDRAALNREPGDFKVISILEFLIFFLCSIGLSDMLPNTLMCKKLHLTDDKNLPVTIIAAALVPGIVLAFSFLNADFEVDMLTLLLFIGTYMTGTYIGSTIVSGLDGRVIKKAMGIALIFSLIALIVKMIISEGAVGTLNGLRGFKLVLMCVLSLAMGAVNMLGVPMKPAITAMFLFMGFTPVNTLSMVLVMGVGALSGGIRIARDKRYNKKVVLAGVIFGSIGAAVGSVMAISLNPTLLNILLMGVMIIAIVSILKPAK